MSQGNSQGSQRKLTLDLRSDRTSGKSKQNLELFSGDPSLRENMPLHTYSLNQVSIFKHEVLHINPGSGLLSHNQTHGKAQIWLGAADPMDTTRGLHSVASLSP